MKSTRQGIAAPADDLQLRGLYVSAPLSSKRSSRRFCICAILWFPPERWDRVEELLEEPDEERAR